MEVYISKKEILKYTGSNDCLPKIYSQMACKTHSKKTTKRGYRYSQVLYFPFTRFISCSSLRDCTHIYTYINCYIKNLFIFYTCFIPIQFCADLSKDLLLETDLLRKSIWLSLNWQNRSGLLDFLNHCHLVS